MFKSHNKRYYFSMNTPSALQKNSKNDAISDIFFHLSITVHLFEIRCWTRNYFVCILTFVPGWAFCGNAHMLQTWNNTTSAFLRFSIFSNWDPLCSKEEDVVRMCVVKAPLLSLKCFILFVWKYDLSSRVIIQMKRKYQTTNQAFNQRNNLTDGLRWIGWWPPVP